MTAGAAPGPEVVVLPDAAAVAGTAAALLLDRLAAAQGARGDASVVLTGGGVGTAALRAVRDAPDRERVDWRRVDVWWGDERWVEATADERNDRQARAALLDALDLDPARVHPMGAPGGPDGDDPDAAAARYAAELAAARGTQDPGGPAVPAFDLLLLGVGGEGHVASVFPESPAARDERPVVAVHGCPKPPPTRLSLAFPALNAAREVAFLVAGEDKAPAVALALSGAGPLQVPAAGVSGRERTVWLLDAAAAARLPADG